MLSTFRSPKLSLPRKMFIPVNATADTVVIIVTLIIQHLYSFSLVHRLLEITSHFKYYIY
jgi:hypothetical protein